MGLLLISHDLVVVEGTVDRVAVFFSGRIVEIGPTREIFSRPLHPYTRELLASAPGRRRRSVPASTRRRSTDPSGPQAGCRYAGRCDMVRPACRETEPQLTRAGASHRVRCPVVLDHDQGTEVDG